MHVPLIRQWMWLLVICKRSSIHTRSILGSEKNSDFLSLEVSHNVLRKDRNSASSSTGTRTGVYDEDQHRNADWCMTRTSTGTQTGIWRGLAEEHGLVYDRTSKGTQTGIWQGPAQEHRLGYDEDQHRNTEWFIWRGPAQEHGLVYD